MPDEAFFVCTYMGIDSDMFYFRLSRGDDKSKFVCIPVCYVPSAFVVHFRAAGSRVVIS